MLHFRVWQQLPETERCEVRGRLAVVGAVRSFSGSQGRPAPTGVASRRLQGPTRDRAGAAQAEAEAGAGARSSGYRACRAVGSDLCVCVCCELSGAQPPPVGDWTTASSCGAILRSIDRPVSFMALVLCANHLRSLPGAARTLKRGATGSFVLWTTSVRHHMLWFGEATPTQFGPGPCFGV
jgi:hypothetical protein